MKRMFLRNVIILIIFIGTGLVYAYQINYPTEITCADKAGPTACTVTQINASDDSYASGGVLDCKDASCWINTTHRTDIPVSASSIFAEAIIEWGVLNGGNFTLKVFKNSTQTWYLVNNTNYVASVVENVFRYNLTQWINTSQDASELKILFDVVDIGPNPNLSYDLVWINISYSVDTTSPTINITYPQNTTYNLNVSQLNYTYSDANPGYCWYSKDGGITNSSNVSAGTNFTNLISIECSNTWIVYCNDSLGNENSSNVTFIMDITTPVSQTPTLTPSNNGGSGGGTTYWKCEIWGEWSECLNNQQTRKCEKKAIATSSTRGDLIESRNCEETEEPLFDVLVSTLPQNEEIFPDIKEISFQIDLIKFKLPEELTEVKINYKINKENETIHEESENLEVQKGTSFIKTIDLPELNPGTYHINIQIEYGNEIAESKTSFIVVEKTKRKELSNFLKTTKSKTYLYVSILVLILIIGIGLFLTLKGRKKRREKKNREEKGIIKYKREIKKNLEEIKS